MGTIVQNLKGKRSTIAKMCCLVQRSIFIVIKANTEGGGGGGVGVLQITFFLACSCM